MLLSELQREHAEQIATHLIDEIWFECTDLALEDGTQERIVERFMDRARPIGRSEAQATDLDAIDVFVSFFKCVEGQRGGRRWIRGNNPDLVTLSDPPEDFAIHVDFTTAGLIGREAMTHDEHAASNRRIVAVDRVRVFSQ